METLSSQGIHTLVYFTISLSVLLACCGMAIDVGRMELRTTQLQAAADDGALTAAAEIQRGNASTYTALVQSEVSAFLTQASLPAATVTGQYIASTGPYNNDYAAMQVTVTQSLPLYFMALAGQASRTLTTRAVALVPPCVYFRSATTLPPNPTVHLASTGFRANCPVYVNVNIINDYFSTEGNSQMKLTGTAAQSAASSGHDVHAPIFNAPVLPDPLSYITAPPSPTLLTCNYFVAVTILSSQPIYPGNYCGGLTITASTVTMTPGLYVIAGPVTITAGSVINGSGVTMYLTKGAGFNYGPFTLTGSTWNVSAPTDSSANGIPGIVLFGDRNWVGGQYDFTFNGGASWNADGIIYTTNTGLNVQYANLSSAGNYFGIETSGMYEYQANIYPTCNYSPLPGGNPFHIAVSLLQ